MHSKLLKRTKWGIGRAICDSKRTALLDAFGFWVDDYSLRVIVTHGVGDPSIHKRHFLALLIGLRLAWLALMTSFLYSMYIKKHLWASFVLFGKHSGHANFQFLSSLFIHISLSFWIDCFCLWSPSLMLLNYYTMQTVDIDFAVVSTC